MNIEYPQMSTKTRQRRAILLAIKSVFSLAVIFLITVVVHEGAHYLTAVILGIPITRFSWFDSKYFAPAIFSASKDSDVSFAIVSYAGGLVTGILFLLILILKRNSFRQSIYGWISGLYLAGLGSWQLCQSILEGAFHDIYISNITSIFSLTSCVGYVSALIGIALYWSLMPQIKNLRI